MLPTKTNKIAGLMLSYCLAIYSQASPIRIVAIRYPIIAAQSRAFGGVHLTADVDALGAVTKIEIIAGPEILAIAAKENLKLWRFTRADGNSVRIVRKVEMFYDFRVVGESEQRGESSFVFEFPNRVTIVTSAVAWQP